VKKIVIAASAAILLTLSGGVYAAEGNTEKKVAAVEQQSVQTPYYSLAVPKSWSVRNDKSGALGFMQNKSIVGTVEVLGYSKDVPLASLLPNHSTVLSSESLKGFAFEVVRFELEEGDAAAAGNTETAKTTHYLIVDKGRNYVYDFSFKTDAVKEQDTAGIIKSFKITTLPKKFTLETGKTMTVTVMVEGMEQKSKVVQYTLQPYGMQFQLDSTFAKQTVNDKSEEASFLRKMGKAGDAVVKLQTVQGKTVKQVVSELQKEFAKAGYKKSGTAFKVEAGSKLAGQRQNYTIGKRFAAFEVYDLGKIKLIVKSDYPAEAGDGMGSIMHMLSSSIQMKR